MLAYLLALVIALGSLVFYLAAFFLPEVHRKYDFIWSGVGLLYALVLWICAGRITGGVLIGQIAGVSLVGWLGWQTLTLRRALIPIDQQTPIPSQAEFIAKIQEILPIESLKGLLPKVTGFIGNLLGKRQDSGRTPAVPADTTMASPTQETNPKTAQPSSAADEATTVASTTQEAVLETTDDTKTLDSAETTPPKIETPQPVPVAKEDSPPAQPESSQEPEQKPEAIAPEAIAPEAITPEAITPEAITPEAKAPEAKAPEAKAPEAKAPEAKAPEAKAPEAKAPEAKAPPPPNPKVE
ncbi:Ycf66 family protein [Moorena sp. SIO4G3]|uniref:Ycf66 family protein n=1 Tax=Moorena sp. SIO4G3 TaxID=2607821 RepID=UPI0025CF6900|nr:Ycf66 family protein [Moorena sp. SIO4G3]